jgi:hypothetical protein
MNWIEAFQKAYNDMSSQDNEGWVADRSSLKAGFCAAWHLQNEKIHIYRDALTVISMPKRTDGTYKLCRQDCEVLASDALEAAREVGK